MIGSLRGTLIDRFEGDQLLVEAGGVGYRLIAPAPVIAGAGELGSDVFLHVHTHVREDAIVLYGFTDRDQRRFFEVLIGAHGVGPSLALAILSVHSPRALAKAVADSDAEALVMVPGVGRKTAARLMVELKARLDIDDTVDIAPAAPGAPRAIADVRAALGGLGYGTEEVSRALRSLPQDGATEELLKAALRELASAPR